LLSYKGSTLVLVEGSGELGDCGWHFDSSQQDPFLSLEGDILGPSDEAGEVPLGLYVIADAEVPGSFFEEWVGLLLNLLRALLANLGSFALSYTNITIDRIKIIY